jgi:hypothetical protein
MEVWRCYQLSRGLHWAYPDVVKHTGYAYPISEKELDALLLIQNRVDQELRQQG